MKSKVLLFILGALGLALGFQNCSPIRTQNIGSPVVAASNPSAGLPDGPIASNPSSNSPSSGGDGGGSSGSMIPSSNPSDPQSTADAVALCAQGLNDGVKHVGNLGSQSGGYEAYQIISMGEAGSLSSGTRIFVGNSSTPVVNSIGSTSISTLVICNLHVQFLGSVSSSRVILVNSQIDQIGSWSSSHVFYDGNTILGTAGSVSNSTMTKLK